MSGPPRPGRGATGPTTGAVSQTDPPSFSWRPQQGLTWEIECARDASFANIVYQAADIEFNVHCPPRTFGPGSYAWRYRGKDKEGRHTDWSKARTFTIADSAVQMPLPSRQELIARIPKTHPRLFLRPGESGPAAGTCSRRVEGQVSRPREGVRQNSRQSAFDAGAAEVSAGHRSPRARSGGRSGGATANTRSRSSTARRPSPSPGCWAARRSTGRRPSEFSSNAPNGTPRAAPATATTTKPACRTTTYFSRTYTFVNDLLTRRGKEHLPQGDEDSRRRDVQPPLPAAPLAALRQPLQPGLAQAGRGRHRLSRRSRGSRGLGVVRDECLLQRLSRLERRRRRLARRLRPIGRAI